MEILLFYQIGRPACLCPPPHPSSPPVNIWKVGAQPPTHLHRLNLAHQTLSSTAQQTSLAIPSRNNDEIPCIHMDVPTSRPPQLVQRMPTERGHHVETNDSDSDSESDTCSLPPREPYKEPSAAAASRNGNAPGQRQSLNDSSVSPPQELPALTIQRKPSQADHVKPPPQQREMQQLISLLQAFTPFEFGQVFAFAQTVKARQPARAPANERQGTTTSESRQKETNRRHTQTFPGGRPFYGRGHQAPNAQTTPGLAAPQQQQTKPMPQHVPGAVTIIRSAGQHDHNPAEVLKKVIGRPQPPPGTRFPGSITTRGAHVGNNYDPASTSHTSMPKFNPGRHTPEERLVAPPYHNQHRQSPQMHPGIQGSGIDVNLRTDQLTPRPTNGAGRLSMPPAMSPTNQFEADQELQRRPQNLPALAHRSLSTLDSGFKVRKENFFSVGRVFKTLWIESAVPYQMRTPATMSSRDTMLGAFGEPIHSKIRTFVVVRTASLYSTCVPIHTYSGRGVLKPGIDSQEHCSVYVRGEPPVDTGRSHLLLPPIRVDPDDRQATLEPSSLIHLGKVCTIEHHAKVRAFGVVNLSSLPVLLRH